MEFHTGFITAETHVREIKMNKIRKVVDKQSFQVFTGPPVTHSLEDIDHRERGVRRLLAH